jgi:hypothetical protein
MILDKTSAALDTTLKAGTALTALLGTVPNVGSAVPGIYDTQAVDGAALPYLTFSHQGGGPDNICPVTLENDLWYVRAYSSSSQKNASEIFEQADLLLNKKQLSITGYTVFWCQRETNIRLVENLPNGGKVWSCGGMYRIRATS